MTVDFCLVGKTSIRPLRIHRLTLALRAMSIMELGMMEVMVVQKMGKRMEMRMRVMVGSM
jgi:hypothetical protein